MLKIFYKKVRFFYLLFAFFFIIRMMKEEIKDLNHIISGCKQGKDSAKKALFEAFSPRMKALCCRYLGNMQDAEDVMIDGFISVYENIGKYKDNNFYGWIYRIMANSCIAYLKRQNRFLFKDDDEFFESDSETEIDNIQRFSKEDLMQALLSLPQSYRIVFNMAVMDDYSYEDICTELSLEKQTVKTMMYRARKKLRDYLTETEKSRSENR